MIKAFFGITILVYVLMGILLFASQRSQIYFSVSELEINLAESFSIRNKDVVLKGWILNQGKPDAQGADDVAFVAGLQGGQAMGAPPDAFVKEFEPPRVLVDGIDALGPAEPEAALVRRGA